MDHQRSIDEQGEDFGTALAPGAGEHRTTVKRNQSEAAARLAERKHLRPAAGTANPPGAGEKQIALHRAHKVKII
jgi:hypothetical protein